jgi:hypothetical protein
MPVKGAINSGGIRMLSNTSGATTRVYRIYQSAVAPASFSFDGTFSKSNGMGDLEALCDAAPVELGNRVWRDDNSNGVQDPNEAGISGVSVRIYRPGTGPDGVAGTADDAASLARAVTDANGEYYFLGGAADTVVDHIGVITTGIAPTGSYEIRLDNPGDRVAPEPLAGLAPTEIDDTQPSPGGSDLNDSDGRPVANPAGSPAGTWPVIAVTMGGPGVNDHTLDFGFRSAAVSVGNQVWFDLNNNGIRNGIEDAPNGVCMQLYSGDGATEIAIGPDGRFGTPDDAPGCVNTDARDGNGTYAFSGLPAGDYVVCLTAPPGYSSSSGSGNIFEPAPDPDGEGAVALNVNGDDNGSLQASGACVGRIASKAVTLNPGDEPNQRAAYAGTIGLTVNDTVDFGLTPVIDTNKFSIGNRVWFDTGAGANTNNGAINADERGAPGLTVTLYSAGATPIKLVSTQTDLFGYYRFDNLDAGSYIVEVARPTGYTPSGAGAESNPNLDVDSNHNCVVAVGTIRSKTRPTTTTPLRRMRTKT